MGDARSPAIARASSQPPPPPARQPNFTKEFRALLANNELGNYDPVKEAFKVYDPQGTGFVDHETLRSIFENLG